MSARIRLTRQPVTRTLARCGWRHSNPPAVFWMGCRGTNESNRLNETATDYRDDPEWQAAQERYVSDRAVMGAESRAVEWGVRHEREGRSHVTVCESEQAAQALRAAAGGEIVTRITYAIIW
jgi:hypothetical protein